MKGVYKIRLKSGTNIKCSSMHIYPEFCHQFLHQQYELLAEIFHFASDFELLKKDFVFDVIHKQFNPSVVKGIEEVGHYIALFHQYLAIFRSHKYFLVNSQLSQF